MNEFERCEWTSVDVDLPLFDGKYLVCRKLHNKTETIKTQCVAYFSWPRFVYTDRTGMLVEMSDVTHWSKLPYVPEDNSREI